MTSTAYLLICVDGIDAAGKAVSAHGIASGRMETMEWPLYKSTGFAKTITTGDSCLIYVGGQRKHSQSFIGFGIVAAVEPAPRRWSEQDSSLVTNPATRLIKFANVEHWARPVSIKAHLDDLYFIKNRSRWGLHMMGGVKRIPVEDFELICNAA